MQTSKSGVNGGDEKNQYHYNNIDTFITRYGTKATPIIGFLCLFLGIYFAMLCFFGLINLDRNVGSIRFALLIFGIIWVGMLHLIFTFRIIWYIE